MKNTLKILNKSSKKISAKQLIKNQKKANGQFVLDVTNAPTLFEFVPLSENGQSCDFSHTKICGVGLNSVSCNGELIGVISTKGEQHAKEWIRENKQSIGKWAGDNVRIFLG